MNDSPDAILEFCKSQCTRHRETFEVMSNVATTFNRGNFFYLESISGDSISNATRLQISIADEKVVDIEFETICDMYRLITRHDGSWTLFFPTNFLNSWDIPIPVFIRLSYKPSIEYLITIVGDNSFRVTLTYYQTEFPPIERFEFNINQCHSRYVSPIIKTTGLHDQIIKTDRAIVSYRGDYGVTLLKEITADYQTVYATLSKIKLRDGSSIPDDVINYIYQKIPVYRYLYLISHIGTAVFPDGTTCQQIYRRQSAFDGYIA